MKVLGIEGSPRKSGNTEKLVRKILEGAEEAGAQTQFIKLIDHDLKFCKGCGTCRATGECVQKDDMEDILEILQRNDVIILGSPVYVWQVTGTTKVFMDRLSRLLTPEFESRIKGEKKIVFAYTQGNADPEIFKPYFNYQEKVFELLGFNLGERILAVGTRGKDDIQAQEAVLLEAHSFGKNLLG